MDYELARQMLRLPSLLEVPSVMVIEPHPDDNEVGAGALVKQWCDQGVAVTYLTVTDGRCGSEDPTVSVDDVIRVRREERRAANRILGVKASYNLGFEDGGAWTEHQSMQALVPLIRQFRPALVLTVDPWTPYESHPDHVKTGKAVAASIIYAKNGVAFRGQGDPWEVPQIAFYGSAYANVFVDVTATWDTKLAAIKAHASQFDGPSWPLLEQFFTSQAHKLYQEHYDSNTAGRSEAFKVLTALQMHFFPDAVRS
ncbi:MAG: PIG-L family deacetylase [Sulfobacillus acidophilus]|uniref:PIG-L family deacetylase n=1 Tax=Sulfobacillus acidophilus TaxID=53633 RepID=A0A2T2WPJ8_9FIRM|nr:MAG: PIG-L family deacetylase [Sulfobacillus acidophilus]